MIAFTEIYSRYILLLSSNIEQHDKHSQFFGTLVRPRLIFPSTITIDSRVDKVSLIKEIR